MSSVPPSPGLGQFLAQKRALAPTARAGRISSRGPKRGLRREEVATLAEVSITDYARIEQGLDEDVSRDDLARITESLHLTEGDRHKAFSLAGLAQEAARKSQSCWTEVLDAMKSVPAFACNGLLDVLAFNPLAGAIFDFEGDGGKYAGNQLWRMYMDPKRRRLFPHPRDEQAQLLESIRGFLALRSPGSPLPPMIEELLQACPAFERDWVQGFRREKASPLVVLRSARLGHVYVEPIRLSMFGSTDEFIVMLMARSKGSRSALRRVQRTLARGQAPQASWHYGPKHLRTVVR